MSSSPTRSVRARLLVAVGAAAAVCVTTSSTALSAPTPSLCVGVEPGCFATVQAAVDAAQAGATITIEAGTFTGGITIDKSIQLSGTSAAATLVRGGGPVITIGSGGTAPVVSISRLTITGGFADGSRFGETAIAGGGGVFVAGPDSGAAAAATVSISDAVITGNRASPRAVVGPGLPCGPRLCSFAMGGGIENAGVLTLTDTRVTGNVAGSTPSNPSVATDASGGGITNHPHATLTVRHSVVNGNRAAVDGALAQLASGGGINGGGLISIEDSEVSGNTVELSSSFPGSIFAGTEPLAEAGGINIAPSGSVTIANSTISGNTAGATSTSGDVNADTGGIDSDGSLTLSNSRVENNQARASVPPASGFGALALGGGLEIASGSTTVNNTRIGGNSISADSATGLAAVLGAGLMNEDGGRLTLHNSDVFANRGSATGAFGFAEGGGIFNSLDPGQLTVIDGTLTDNVMTASSGITPLGGGLFTADVFSLDPLPAKLVHTRITGNQPDQCFGC